MRTPYPNELMHYGVMGMKWGVRRYQNPDGTLTAEGRAHYGVTIQATDSAVTKKAKRDFNTLSEQEFRKKYATTKEVYARRVKKYGDPYMNSPLAKTGKKLAAKQKAKAESSSRALEKEIQALENSKDKIAMSDSVRKSAIEGLVRQKELTDKKIKDLDQELKTGTVSNRSDDDAGAISVAFAKRQYDRLKKIENDTRRMNRMTDRQEISLKNAQKYWKERSLGKKHSDIDPKLQRSAFVRTEDWVRSYSLGERAAQRAVINGTKNVIKEYAKNKSPGPASVRSTVSTINYGKVATNTALETVGDLYWNNFWNVMFGHF